ncbi:MAG: hypothetical protein FWF22_08200 [Treponema sp.]|nr:hypothetical protein [Treponema sp.]
MKKTDIKIVNDNKAYEQIIRSFRTKQRGATPADIAADTGLPLNTVRELVPKAADEYSGRLEVTESGEILYSFPHGFTSRYRGFLPAVRRFREKLIKVSVKTGTVVFKVWIMVMLIGYFLLFMAIALASLFLSAAANSNNRSRRGGNMFFGMGIFNLIIRLWFYSELTKSLSPNAGYRKSSKPSKPLYKAIFSFVFGDGDPNASWDADTKKSFIAYLKEKNGVISLPEFMVITGLKPDEAENAITAMCVEFNGSPEATEDGTVVYRFDEILLGSQTAKKQNDLPLLFKTGQNFSSNPGNMNRWFSVINGVNLLFGTFFLYNAAVIGHINATVTHGVYWLVYSFLAPFSDPVPIIAICLGIVPLTFSLVFWLIPLLRNFFRKKKNKEIRFENFRKFSFSRIWNSPLAVKKTDLNPAYKEAGPENLKAAQDLVLKEMGNYVIPEVIIDDSKNEIYSFVDLEREKKALEKYRSTVNPEASSLGKTVFDSGQ